MYSGKLNISIESLEKATPASPAPNARALPRPGAWHVRVARATPVALQLDYRCACCLRAYVPNRHLHRLSLTPPCVACTPSCGSLLARCRSWLRPKSSSCRRGCSHASPGAVVSSTPPRTRPPRKQRMPVRADRQEHAAACDRPAAALPERGRAPVLTLEFVHARGGVWQSLLDRPGPWVRDNGQLAASAFVAAVAALSSHFVAASRPRHMSCSKCAFRERPCTHTHTHTHAHTRTHTHTLPPPPAPSFVPKPQRLNRHARRCVPRPLRRGLGPARSESESDRVGAGRLARPSLCHAPVLGRTIWLHFDSVGSSSDMLLLGYADMCKGESRLTYRGCFPCVVCVCVCDGNFRALARTMNPLVTRGRGETSGRSREP